VVSISNKYEFAGASASIVDAFKEIESSGQQQRAQARQVQSIDTNEKILEHLIVYKLIKLLRNKIWPINLYCELINTNTLTRLKRKLKAEIFFIIQTKNIVDIV
jgi:hypothetical protein